VRCCRWCGSIAWVGAGKMLNGECVYFCEDHYAMYQDTKDAPGMGGWARAPMGRPRYPIVSEDGEGTSPGSSEGGTDFGGHSQAQDHPDEPEAAPVPRLRLVPA
jgi:hypothetical protein